MPILQKEWNHQVLHSLAHPQRPLGPSPDEPPYVKVGDTVKEGDTLCIIEAMKMMNQVTAEQAGTIVEILVEDSEPVEFGQPLFIIK